MTDRPARQAPLLGLPEQGRPPVYCRNPFGGYCDLGRCTQLESACRTSEVPVTDPARRVPRMYVRSPLEQKIDVLLDATINAIRDGFRPLFRSAAALFRKSQ